MICRRGAMAVGPSLGAGMLRLGQVVSGHGCECGPRDNSLRVPALARQSQRVSRSMCGGDRRKFDLSAGANGGGTQPRRRDAQARTGGLRPWTWRGGAPGHRTRVCWLPPCSCMYNVHCTSSRASRMLACTCMHTYIIYIALRGALVSLKL